MTGVVVAIVYHVEVVSACLSQPFVMLFINVSSWLY